MSLVKVATSTTRVHEHVIMDSCRLQDGQSVGQTAKSEWELQTPKWLPPAWESARARKPRHEGKLTWDCCGCSCANVSFWPECRVQEVWCVVTESDNADEPWRGWQEWFRENWPPVVSRHVISEARDSSSKT